jgi:hypothetical protein
VPGLKVSPGIFMPGPIFPDYQGSTGRSIEDAKRLLPIRFGDGLFNASNVDAATLEYL